MNEERIVTESVAKEGQMVHATVNSKGWQKVIAPALANRKKALLAEFSNAAKYEEFVRIQQSVNAIDSVTDFIEVKLMEGREALKDLRKDAEHP